MREVHIITGPDPDSVNARIRLIIGAYGSQRTVRIVYKTKSVTKVRSEHNGSIDMRHVSPPPIFCKIIEVS